MTRLRSWLFDVGRDLNGWLREVPTTQYKTLVGATLAFLSFILFAAVTLLEKHLEEIAWGLWLGFVAAWAALDYKQFKAKRDTWKPDGTDAPTVNTEPKL